MINLDRKYPKGTFEINRKDYKKFKDFPDWLKPYVDIINKVFKGSKPVAIKR